MIQKGHGQIRTCIWCCKCGAKLLVRINVVQYASSELRTVMMAKYDHTRTDYLRQANELSCFVQSVEKREAEMWLVESWQASAITSREQILKSVTRVRRLTYSAVLQKQKY